MTTLIIIIIVVTIIIIVIIIISVIIIIIVIIIHTSKKGIKEEEEKIAETFSVRLKSKDCFSRRKINLNGYIFKQTFMYVSEVPTRS